MLQFRYLDEAEEDATGQVLFRIMYQQSRALEFLGQSPAALLKIVEAIQYLFRCEVNGKAIKGVHCAICLEDNCSDVQNLDCSHRFCTACIRDLVIKSEIDGSGGFNCPLCRGPLKPKAEWWVRAKQHALGKGSKYDEGMAFLLEHYDLQRLSIAVHGRSGSDAKVGKRNFIVRM